MPIIYTRRNYVSFGYPRPEDLFVATFVMPLYSPRRLLCSQPIDRLESAIRWAMEMADYMENPLEIVPITSEDDFFRQLAVAIGFEGANGWDKPPEEQQAGRDLLVSLGVIKQ